MAGQDCLNREGQCERERPEEVGEKLSRSLGKEHLRQRDQQV